ncbi:MAG TPA: serine/threonine-protein kinase [Armatimonadota bacterium]|nr:serine/threonine-protein kinase [Armatimonadota bacterium]
MSANTLGRYQIVREIARSNDVVYEAVDPSINRHVALKELLLPPNLSGAQKRERVERFYREARAAGLLSHPNIVTIYEVGEDRGRHFIAMELLEGQTLRDVLDMEGSLPIDRVMEIAKQACDALVYAHSKGVIHRDIKPDNIQTLPSGRIKITDFGIARIMEEPSITANGQVFGTPSYMSPEQVAGKPLDPRTDIFSLGIVLYEMLTGRKPFTGDTVVTITYNIMNQDVTFPPTLPPHFERVLRRCLAKDPNLRYSSAAEVAADLDPGSYRDLQAMPQPDAAGATVSIPGPFYGPAPTYPQPPKPPSPDPFAHMRPGDIPLPRLPSKPILSAEAKYFLKVMLAVISVCGLVIALVWLLSAGYQGWQRAAREQEVRTHIEAGERHFKSESYQAAIEEFDKVLRLSADPAISKVVRRNIAVSYTELGIQSDRTGNPVQAITYYKQALVSDDTYADAYLFLGSSLKKMHQDDQALAAWEKAVQVGGGSEAASIARQYAADIYDGRGNQAYRQGNTDAAVHWWRKALEIAPGTQVGFSAQEKIDSVTGGGTR